MFPPPSVSFQTTVSKATNLESKRKIAILRAVYSMFHRYFLPSYCVQRLQTSRSWPPGLDLQVLTSRSWPHSLDLPGLPKTAGWAASSPSQCLPVCTSGRWCCTACMASRSSLSDLPRACSDTRSVSCAAGLVECTAREWHKHTRPIQQGNKSPIEQSQMTGLKPVRKPAERNSWIPWIYSSVWKILRLF